MTSWREVYTDVVDEVKSLLQNLTDDQGNSLFDTVYVGFAAAPKQYPCCFILPDRVRPSPAAPESTVYDMGIEIRVISRDPSSESGLKDVIYRLGKVEDALISDRTLNGKVDNLEITEIRPTVTVRITRDRHEGSLLVSFRRLIRR